MAHLEYSFCQVFGQIPGPGVIPFQPIFSKGQNTDPSYSSHYPCTPLHPWGAGVCGKWHASCASLAPPTAGHVRGGVPRQPERPRPAVRRHGGPGARARAGPVPAARANQSVAQPGQGSVAYVHAQGGGWLSAVIWAFGDNLAMLLLSWECNAGNALLHNTTLQLYVSIILQYRQHSFEQCSVCCTLWATRIYPPPPATREARPSPRCLRRCGWTARSASTAPSCSGRWCWAVWLWKQRREGSRRSEMTKCVGSLRRITFPMSSASELDPPGVP